VPSDANLPKHLLGIMDSDFTRDEFGEEGISGASERNACLVVFFDLVLDYESEIKIGRDQLR
jgi:hypothetical protein